MADSVTIADRRRVVVTGLGTINPLGNDVETSWEAMLKGSSGAGPITLFDSSEYRAHFACEVKGYDPLDHFEKRELRRLDRYTQLFLISTRQALQDADIDFASDDDAAARAGVVVGAGFGGMNSFIRGIDTMRAKGPSRLSPTAVPEVIPNIAAGIASIDHNLLGPVTCVVTACSASANAIGDAAEIIRRGAADVMVAGGSEAAINEFGLASFGQARALSTRNDDPEHASRPFDAQRDGFVIGEGAAAVVLEAEEIALDRGARIYAEVTGYGMSADAYHITLPRPGGTGAARAMTAALSDASLEPADLDYINAHGTSTEANDATETAAIKVALGDDVAHEVPISSTKSMTGHVLGGSGAVEAAACIMAIRDNMLPPTINYEFPDPECDLDYVPNDPRAADVDHVMTNSFGFGGHNVALVFSRYS